MLFALKITIVAKKCNFQESERLGAYSLKLWARRKPGELVCPSGFVTVWIFSFSCVSAAKNGPPFAFQVENSWFHEKFLDKKTTKSPVFMRLSITFVLLYHIPPLFWQSLLRCPIKSSGLRFSSILSTAATRSGRSSRHRRRSPHSPYFTNYAVSICKREQIILDDFVFTMQFEDAKKAVRNAPPFWGI